MNVKPHPMITFLGTRDDSLRPTPSPFEAKPQNCGLFFHWAAWGSTKTTFNDGASFVNRYHEKTLEARSNFVTHVTPFIKGAHMAGAYTYNKRLLAPGSKQAGLTIAVEILEDDIPLFELNEQGLPIIDDNGNQTPAIDGATTRGYRGTPIVTNLDFDAIGDGTVVEGSQQGPYGTSKIYKIMDLPAKYFGSLGNGIGIRISSPTLISGDIDVNDIDLMETIKSYIHKIEFVLRENVQFSPNTWKTISGQKKVEFSLKPGAYNPTFKNDLYLPDVYEINYTDENTDTDGPLSEIYLYEENIEELLTKFHQSESVAPNNRIPTDPDSMYLMNIFRPYHYDGTPYRSIIYQGSLNNVPEFTDVYTHYLTDGSDGDMTAENFEAAVGSELAAFGDNDHYRDIARFRFSSFYDSGFNPEVKDYFGRIISLRPDVDICTCPFVASVARPNPIEELSLAQAIKAQLRQHPESSYYGTGTMRAVIVGQSARPSNNDEYKKRVPGNYELFMKRMMYLGSGDGKRKSQFAYTGQTDNKRVQYLKNRDLEDTWVDPIFRGEQWQSGLVNFYSYGEKENFLPAVQTITESNDSVLNSEKVMLNIGIINRICFDVWKELVGDEDMTELQFIEASNTRIKQLCKGTFESNFEVIPETYFDDTKSKAMWCTRVHIGAPYMKFMNESSVIAHSLEDLRNSNIG